MTSRDRIHTIISGSPADRCGFWLGNPHPDSLPIYHKYFGTSTLDELQLKVGDDFRWITPLFIESSYQHPEGKGIFDLWRYKKSLGEAGPLSECESLDEVESYAWPDVRYINLTECLQTLRNAGGFYRASGFWTPFFHDVMDIFGPESFLTKMYTHPEIVHAVTDHVCAFYTAANELLFTQAGDLIDGFFFGNDFGTQRDVLMSTVQFDEFVLPWIRRFAGQARRHGLQVITHSCGSVHLVIDRLIDAGIQCLHPLQAKAFGMDAETLVRDFGGRIAFLGGIDTQELLVKSTPEQIRQEVRRLKDIFGPGWIASPSHEALLPDIPPRNVAAMADAILES
jgi:uroporphyrinogen decarboxylase